MIVPHKTSDKSLGGFYYCTVCGLVYLKNDITYAAQKYGCYYEDSPEFLKISRRIRQQQKERLLERLGKT